MAIPVWSSRERAVYAPLQRHQDNSQLAFTLIELLVVIAIIAVLAGILFPVFAGAKAHSRSATCMNNLKQIGVAVKAYCNDYSDRMPVIDTLFAMRGTRPAAYNPFNDPTRATPQAVIGDYLVDVRVLRCPSAVNGLPSGAGTSGWLQSYVFYGRDYEQTLYGGDEPQLDLNQFSGQVQQTTLAHGAASEAAGVIWVRDSIARDPSPRSRKVFFPHLGGTMNRLYSDGHVARTDPDSHALAADF